MTQLDEPQSKGVHSMIGVAAKAGTIAVSFRACVTRRALQSDWIFETSDVPISVFGDGRLSLAIDKRERQ